ncbi:hypothetical protein F5884DRAFT_806983 [Xylogone sp. PMI_703]|nr:hypothetical protein F5884DRAFT_806983 [Xylogone sp. PMI_703]
MLGPLDKRINRTRCVACAHRKIKCDGGRPCVYCLKKGLKCTSQVIQRNNDRIFVHHQESRPETNATSSAICREVPPDISQQYLAHFFSDFLTTNNFGSELLDLETIGRFQSSPSLYHALLAIGALDLGHKSSFPLLRKRGIIMVQALTAYRTAIAAVKDDMASGQLLKSDASLWTTFFLGIFELMYDASGEGWIKHMLYGTSKILQARGPAAHLSGPGRLFFITVRVFEICRALIYLEPTFLTSPPWISLMKTMWDGDLVAYWHPKEDLFDSMLDCLDLSLNVMNVLKKYLDLGQAPPDSILFDLALAGHRIQSDLNEWYLRFQLWGRQTLTNNTDERSLLASTYYHAISIFLSGIFDYNMEFNHIITPALSFDAIQFHVTNILDLAEVILHTTRLSRVLLFFPLRVAGARARTTMQKKMILMMLSEISTRSFVVAGAFTTDLQKLWDS